MSVILNTAMETTFYHLTNRIETYSVLGSLFICWFFTAQQSISYNIARLIIVPLIFLHISGQWYFTITNNYRSTPQFHPPLLNYVIHISLYAPSLYMMDPGYLNNVTRMVWPPSFIFKLEYVYPAKLMFHILRFASRLFQFCFHICMSIINMNTTKMPY